MTQMTVVTQTPGPSSGGGEIRLMLSRKDGSCVMTRGRYQNPNQTLAYRSSDALDFHEVSVGQIKLALRAAYEAGRQSRK